MIPSFGHDRKTAADKPAAVFFMLSPTTNATDVTGTRHRPTKLRYIMFFVDRFSLLP